MCNKFKVTIFVSGNKKFDEDKHKTKYWEGTNTYDYFRFTDNCIVLNGSRTGKLSNSDFFTVRSTKQFSTEKALLYYWIKYGGFKIEKLILKFGNDQEEEIVSENKDIISQSFKDNPPKMVSEWPIDDLLEIWDVHNDLFACLTYLLPSSEDYFANYWKCLNHIYNSIYKNYRYNKVLGSKDKVKFTSEDLLIIEKKLKEKEERDKKDKKDKNSKGHGNATISDLNAIMYIWKKLQKGKYQKVKLDYSNYSNFILKDLGRTRLVRWVSEETKSPQSTNKVGLDNYTDPQLISLLLDSIKERYGSNDANQPIKKVTKKNKPGNQSPVDFVLCVLLYSYHTRNKYFHGEYKNPQFLIKYEAASKEKFLLGQLLKDLDWQLINQKYDLLLNNSYSQKIHI